jgi:hypothetical protein
LQLLCLEGNTAQEVVMSEAKPMDAEEKEIKSLDGGSDEKGPEIGTSLD